MMTRELCHIVNPKKGVRQKGVSCLPIARSVWFWCLLVGSAEWELDFWNFGGSPDFTGACRLLDQSIDYDSSAYSLSYDSRLCRRGQQRSRVGSWFVHGIILHKDPPPYSLLLLLFLLDIFWLNVLHSLSCHCCHYQH